MEFRYSTEPEIDGGGKPEYFIYVIDPKTGAHLYHCRDERTGSARRVGTLLSAYNTIMSLSLQNELYICSLTIASWQGEDFNQYEIDLNDQGAWLKLILTYD